MATETRRWKGDVESSSRMMVSNGWEVRYEGEDEQRDFAGVPGVIR